MDKRSKQVIEQYKKPSNFEARRNLFGKYSTNKYDWYKWIFDHFDFPASSTILELGCGLSSLWRNNKGRIKKNWNITLS